jgi:hypothetical protein
LYEFPKVQTRLTFMWMVGFTGEWPTLQTQSQTMIEL